MAQLSTQQQAVVSWTRDGKGSAFVEAVAGAGKTTTLIELIKETRGSVAFAAYNKKIAAEISTKVVKLNLGNRARVGTFHSFGFSAVRRIYDRVLVDADIKRRETANILFGDLGTKHPLEGFCSKLISLAKQNAIGLHGAIDDESLWYDIIDHHDLAYEIEDERLIAEGVAKSIEGLRHHVTIAPRVIDFDDMIYIPVVTGCRTWENDWVLVDECQDTNSARRALARKMLRRNGRSVWVGDRNQAIYGFTGADSDAVDQIVRDFACKVFPLTVTYRCPKSVVAQARTVVDHIQAHETAPDGNVELVQELNIPEFAPTPDDAILCRNTKPLVETAYRLISKGIACHVEGRDIGTGLLKLLDRFKSARTLPALRDKLAAYAEVQVAKLTAKGKETQAEALQDRVDTLVCISETATSVEDVATRIKSLFEDSENEKKPTLTLSTVHKSKGREWNRVVVLGRDEFMPSRWARQDWQLQQEDNLIYVAYTRAMRELIIVSSATVTFQAAKIEENTDAVQ